MTPTRATLSSGILSSGILSSRTLSSVSVSIAVIVTIMAQALGAVAIPQAGEGSTNDRRAQRHSSLVQNSGLHAANPQTLPRGTVISVHSSPSLVGINEVLERRFETAFAGSEIELRYAESDTALAALRQGQIDLVAMGRPLSAAEQQQGYRSVVIDRNKIALIVSDRNPITTSITTSQIGQIAQGTLTTWAELEPGLPGTIRWLQYPADSDIRRSLEDYGVFQDTTATENTIENTAGVFTDTDALINALGADGIGYAIADQVFNRPGIRVLAMHQVMPDEAEYPFSQPLSYVYYQTPSPSVQAFLTHVETTTQPELLQAAKELGAGAELDSTTQQPTLNLAKLAELVVASPATVPSATPTRWNQGDASDDNGGLNEETATSSPDSEPSPDRSGGETLAQTPGVASDDVATDSATSDGAIPEEPDANTAAVQMMAEPQRSNSWWLLWLIGLPLLGVLLWWVLTNESDDDDGGGAIPTSLADADPTFPTLPQRRLADDAAPLSNPFSVFPLPQPQPTLTAKEANEDENPPVAAIASSLVIHPQAGQQVTIHWYPGTDDDATSALVGDRQRVLQLYDITGIDPRTQTPHSVQQVRCDDSEQSWSLSVAQTDRVYLADLGYVTPDGQWIRVANSAPVFVPTIPAPPNALPPLSRPDPKPSTIAPTSIPMQIGTQDGDTVWVSWQLDGEIEAQLAAQDVPHLTLLLYDVTHIDLSNQSPHHTYGFNCGVDDRQYQASALPRHRDYLAELGYHSSTGEWTQLGRSLHVYLG